MNIILIILIAIFTLILIYLFTLKTNNKGYKISPTKVEILSKITWKLGQANFYISAKHDFTIYGHLVESLLYFVHPVVAFAWIISGGIPTGVASQHKVDLGLSQGFNFLDRLPAITIVLIFILLNLPYLI